MGWSRQDAGEVVGAAGGAGEQPGLGPGAPGVTSGAPEAPAPPEEATGAWHRQHPRMFLVHPVKLLRQLLPLLVVALVGGQGEGWFQVLSTGLAAVLAVVLTLVQFLTLRYRVGEETVEVRQGWLFRSTKTARLERVRTIDVEGDLLMRLLDLRTVKIGTGVDDTQVELEGLRTADARELREKLLRRTRQVQGGRGPGVAPGEGAAVRGAGGLEAGPGASADGGAGAAGAVTESEQGAAEERPLVAWDTGWLRFAPLGASGLIVAGAVMGFGSQFSGELAESAFVQRLGGRLLHLVEGLGVASSIGLVVVGTAALALLTSFIAYVIGWWGLRVTRSGHGTLHVTRGLTTTRSATLEERKVRGVMVTEPWQQRWQRGASLSAVVTGAEEGSVELLPTVPRRTARAVAVDVLGSGESHPVPADLFTMPLRSHGLRALRRMVVGALLATLWVGLLPVVAAMVPLRHYGVVDPLGWGGPWQWAWLLAWTVLVGVVMLAPVWPAWRSLGHAVTDRHLVVREGAVLRRHLALECEGVLSWNLRQSFFQRRLDLCDAVATVAGGDESYEVPNVPVPDAVAMMRAVSPDLVGQFSRPA